MQNIAKGYIVIHLVILFLVGWFAYAMGMKENSSKTGEYYTYRDGEYYFTFEYPSSAYISTIQGAYPDNTILLLRMPGSQAYDLYVMAWDNEEQIANEFKFGPPDLTVKTRGSYITFDALEDNDPVMKRILESVHVDGF